VLLRRAPRTTRERLGGHRARARLPSGASVSDHHHMDERSDENHVGNACHSLSPAPEPRFPGDRGRNDGVQNHFGLRPRVALGVDPSGRGLMDQRAQLGVRRQRSLDGDSLGLRVAPAARRSLDRLRGHHVPRRLAEALQRASSRPCESPVTGWLGGFIGAGSAEGNWSTWARSNTNTARKNVSVSPGSSPVRKSRSLTVTGARIRIAFSRFLNH
jgi:hypothetical protein